MLKWDQNTIFPVFEILHVQDFTFYLVNIDFWNKKVQKIECFKIFFILSFFEFQIFTSQAANPCRDQDMFRAAALNIIYLTLRRFQQIIKMLAETF